MGEEIDKRESEKKNIKTYKNNNNNKKNMQKIKRIRIRKNEEINIMETKRNE